MTRRSWLNQATERLTVSGAPDARLDAEWMLCDALSIPRSMLRPSAEQELTPDQQAQMDMWLSRREAGVPLQYVQNRAYFMGLTYYVDERALIPRQDSEVLCERALALIDGRHIETVLDLCTGSGAFAVAVKALRKNVRVTATDLSQGALEVARRNAEARGADVEFVRGDLFSAVPGRRFDLILCNPPYVSDADMLTLQSEVRREPELALRGGADGLDVYRRIAGELRDHLNPGGVALFEVGMGQAEAVRQLLLQAMPEGVSGIEKDLNGIDRVVEIKRTV